MGIPKQNIYVWVLHNPDNIDNFHDLQDHPDLHKKKDKGGGEIIEMN